MHIILSLCIHLLMDTYSSSASYYCEKDSNEHACTSISVVRKLRVLLVYTQ